MALRALDSDDTGRAERRLRKHAAALSARALSLAAVNAELRTANRRLTVTGEHLKHMLEADSEAALGNAVLQAIAGFTGARPLVLLAGRKSGLAVRMGLGVSPEMLELFVPCPPAAWRGLAPFDLGTNDLALETAVSALLGDEFYYLPLGPRGRAFALLAVAGAPAQADRVAVLRLLPAAGQLLAQMRRLRSFRVLAERDSLTGLRNHATLQRALRLEIKRHQRGGRPLSLVLFDVDHFKAVNDTHGHPVGDKVLAIVAALLTRSSRESDLAARYGGEEFALVLPDTDRSGAEHKVAEFLGTVRALDLGLVGPLTLSAGIATFPDDGHAAAELVRAADRALYAAKNSGRDRAMTYADWLASMPADAENNGGS